MKYALIFFGLAFFTFGCTPEPGIGGKATINGTVKHHSENIPGATVYIKYGTTQSPGTDISFYDDLKVAGADAKISFTELNPGDYYLYCVGYDSLLGDFVEGGVPINIPKKSSVVTAVIPVTE